MSCIFSMCCNNILPKVVQLFCIAPHFFFFSYKHSLISFPDLFSVSRMRFPRESNIRHFPWTIFLDLWDLSFNCETVWPIKIVQDIVQRYENNLSWSKLLNSAKKQAIYDNCWHFPSINLMSLSYFPLSKASPEPTSFCTAVVPLVPIIVMNTFASVPAPSELPVVIFKAYSEKINIDQQFYLSKTFPWQQPCFIFLRSYEL